MVVTGMWANGWMEMYGYFLQIFVIFSLELEGSSYTNHEDGTRGIRDWRMQEAGVSDLGELERKFIRDI